MKIGWLADRSPIVGGAELTQQEFRDCAPEGVEIVDCPPGEVEKGLDRYVIHNCHSYSVADVKHLHAPLVKYVHDMWPAKDAKLRSYLLRRANLIFCSPLQLERFPHRIRSGKRNWTIPPAMDLTIFRKASETNGTREGCCCVGRMAYGKGLQHLSEWPEPVDVYSSVPFDSIGNARYKGLLDPDEVASTLAHYRTFVFLPTALEPFGRAVAEAWAAGCEMQINGNIGALDWIGSDSTALVTAGADFWAVVLGA